MRAVIQRVKEASVDVDGRTIGKIADGLLILLGVEDGDEASDLQYVYQKTTGLRIFQDDEGKMNRSVSDIGGELLVVSQFTLLGDVRKGKRPSFTASAGPERAKELYEAFCDLAKNDGFSVATGEFGAHMEVKLLNDGPVTILLDSRKRF